MCVAAFRVWAATSKEMDTNRGSMRRRLMREITDISWAAFTGL
jgi:hypothetical protein